MGAEGGARFTAGRIKACFDGMSEKTELHLVGHSAGSIFLAHLIPVLAEIGQPVKSLTLFAPACSLSLFDEKIAGHIGQNIERFVMFNLTDEVERDDSVGPAYHKSLLYLVTEAFEQRHRVPLLGMEAFIDPAKKAYGKLPPEDRKLSKRVQRIIGKAQPSNGRTTIRALKLPASIKLESDSTTHGGFDNDEATLNATLRIITGKQSLAKAF